MFYKTDELNKLKIYYNNNMFLKQVKRFVLLFPP